MLSQLLNSPDPVTQHLRSDGITTWNRLMSYVQQLPYGRNSDRGNFDLVILEKKGTCSSKHAFLKKQAHLNGIAGVDLILAIYKMNHLNTPGIGSTLTAIGLDHIPEAHCYLRFKEQRLDLTNTQSDIAIIIPDLIEEQVILPEQVIKYKVDYHKKFLESWIRANDISFSFEEIWKLRESCIEKLSLLK